MSQGIKKNGKRKTMIIDEKLIHQVKKLLHCKTDTDAVEESLKRVISSEKMLQFFSRARGISKHLKGKYLFE